MSRHSPLAGVLTSGKPAPGDEPDAGFRLSASVWTFAPAAQALPLDGHDIGTQGTPGDDVDPGTPGNDTLFGDAGNDSLSGALGNDQLFGGDGNDVLRGDAGNDTLVGNRGADSISGGDDADVIYGASSSSGVSEAGDSADTLRGGNGNDLLRGNAGDDQLFGDAGDDNLRGDAGNDVLDGGAGNDFVSYRFDEPGSFAGGGMFAVSFSAAVVTGAGEVQLVDGFGGVDTVRGFESLGIVGTPFGDQFTGSGIRDQISGGGGGDTIAGGSGNDTVVGGDGDDSLLGGNGADTLQGDGDDDTLMGGSGNDSLVGGEGEDTVSGGSGNDTLDAGGFGMDPDDWDTVSYADAPSAVVVNLATGSASGGAGNDLLLGQWDVVVGSHHGDTLIGSAYDVELEAEEFDLGNGNDSVDGGAGLDAVLYDRASAAVIVNLGTGRATGGSGNDTLVGIEGVWGSNFNDTLIGGGDEELEGFAGGLGNDMVDGGSGFDVFIVDGDTGVNVNLATGRATGAEGNDTLTGIEGAFGDDGNDSLTGNALDNWLDGDDGYDTLSGGDGIDTLDGGDEPDSLRGGNGNDELAGGDGNDTVLGDAGNDLIDGGPGNDSLVGGDGSDTANYGGQVGVGGPVQVNLGTGFTAGAYGNDTLTSIENVNGTGFTDNIIGSTGNNRLAGGAGNDTLLGGTGNDRLDGGAGSDNLYGEAGNDTLIGGEVLDRVNYSDGNFASWTGATSGVNLNVQTGVVLDGRGGTDQISNITFFFASDHADTIVGSTALIFESFEGGLGNDTIDGGVITDTLNLDNSNRVSYASAPAAVHVNLVLGTATGGAGNDVLLNISSVRGSNGFNDTLTGSDQSAITESFEGRGGNDIIDGAGGTDLARYDAAASAVSVNLATGTASDGNGGTDTLFNIESVRASAWNDTLTGGAVANGTGERDGFEGFEGRAGNDLINGAGGYDRADYHNTLAAVNVVLGGAANGTAFDGYGGTDTLINIEGVRGSPFADTLTGSNDAGQFESFEGREGNDTIDGNGGTDRADYLRSRAAVVVNLATGTASDGYGGTDVLLDIEEVRGSRDFADSITGSTAANLLDGQGGNDSLAGGDGVDTLVGGNGNDRLDGGVLNDSMAGGAGNDSYVVNNTGDVISEASSSGSDSVSANVSYGLSVNIEKLTLTGTASINGSGNGNANTITGNSGNNTLSGSTGNDTLSGGNGNDSLNGGSGNDSMSGGAGNDAYSVDAVGDIVVEAAGGGTDTVNSTVTTTLPADVERLVLGGTTAINGSGNAGANTITGNSGNNTLSGSTGNDTLSGSGGNDSLIGGAGNDSLTGGAGVDRFVLDSLTGSDILADFSSGSDKLVVRQSAVAVGDGDTAVEGAILVAGPGGFSSSAELVVVSGNIAGSITAASAAARIGSAGSAYSVGRDVLFLVDNGASSAVYLFSALDANALVSSTELTLLAMLTTTPATAVADLLFV